VDFTAIPSVVDGSCTACNEATPTGCSHAVCVTGFHKYSAGSCDKVIAPVDPVSPVVAGPDTDDSFLGLGLDNNVLIALLLGTVLLLLIVVGLFVCWQKKKRRETHVGDAAQPAGWQAPRVEPTVRAETSQNPVATQQAWNRHAGAPLSPDNSADSSVVGARAVPY
jgi:hypothetical protein